MPTSFAALDIGSNTFRLIIAEKGPEGILVGTKKVWQEVTRLSQGLSPGGGFGSAPLKRAFTALDHFAEILQKENPQGGVLAAGTMAVRESADGKEFMKELNCRYGWNSKILSGNQEAFLSARGVQSELIAFPNCSLIFDIGGRSTELIRTYKREISLTKSLPLGVVSLTEKFIHHDPPTTQEVLAMKDYIFQTLSGKDMYIRVKNLDEIIGTAGTVTTICAMLLSLENYDPLRVNGARIPLEDIEALLTEVIGETLIKRSKRIGLHPKRADVIVAGLALTCTLLEFFRGNYLLVSDASLLEGLWLLQAGVISIGELPVT
ncbi:MAG: hypothetical protein LBE38_03170 [Deltaproteobacteria bacterium]|nr:hypothetical protein [Deltaproteobacteria bacterium]